MIHRINRITHSMQSLMAFQGFESQVLKMINAPTLYIYDCTQNFEPHQSAADFMKRNSLPMRRKILAKHSHIEESALEFSMGENGKPSLKNSVLKFNVSHSGSLWAMMIHSDEDLGIDIERHKPRKMMNQVMEQYFHANELAAYQALPSVTERESLFFKLWTQKEAYAKYLGKGLGYDFSSTSFLPSPPEEISIFTIDYAQSAAPAFTLSIASKTEIFPSLLRRETNIKGFALQGLQLPEA